MLSFSPLDVLNENLDLIGSVAEGFPTYSPGMGSVLHCHDVIMPAPHYLTLLFSTVTSLKDGAIVTSG